MVSEKNNTILNIHPQTDSATFQVDTAFANEIAHFIECIQSGKEPLSPVEDGVAITKILNAVYTSAQLGKEVHL